jgi:transposase, IS6 family
MCREPASGCTSAQVFECLLGREVAGHWTYLYRAVDQYGQVIDVLLSVRRDLAAARRFVTRALRAGTVPAEVTTDRAPVHPTGAR